MGWIIFGVIIIICVYIVVLKMLKRASDEDDLRDMLLEKENQFNVLSDLEQSTLDILRNACAEENMEYATEHIM